MREMMFLCKSDDERVLCAIAGRRVPLFGSVTCNCGEDIVSVVVAISPVGIERYSELDCYEENQHVYLDGELHGTEINQAAWVKTQLRDADCISSLCTV